MGKTQGVYIMRVAAMITGMHPQTLRKYERAGLLEPARSRNLRMYSDEDIARLKTIKHMVDSIGLNLAGVRIALRIQDVIISVQKQLKSSGLDEVHRTKMLRSLDESLGILGTILGEGENELVYSRQEGKLK
jgi:MerR family transcriptional regulator/heat shock protein HspR